ncbi:unnamed protein product [Clonostachys chloroleuca]|uniref:Uncharacterized protein n=1 Tax=Clonostachys chloroleuca TaxID=1926264 RepID=A0AA35M0C1_9HYPO|nr:unnamed protein product [Clonostachys chloroleuca]
MRFSTVIASSMVCFAASGVALDLERRVEAYALGEELIARGEHLIARGKTASPAKKAAAPGKKGASPPKGNGKFWVKGYCQKDGRTGFCVTPEGSPNCAIVSPCSPDMGTCYWGGGGVLCQNQ